MPDPVDQDTFDPANPTPPPAPAPGPSVVDQDVRDALAAQKRIVPEYPSAAQAAAAADRYKRAMSAEFKRQYDRWLGDLYNTGAITPETYEELSEADSRVALLNRYDQLQAELPPRQLVYDPETGNDVSAGANPNDPRWVSFGAFLTSYITPSFQEIPLNTPEKDVIPTMRRTAEALIRSDLRLPQVRTEEGAFIVDETGEVVPVSPRARAAAAKGVTLTGKQPAPAAPAGVFDDPATALANEMRSKGFVLAPQPGMGREDAYGRWWVTPEEGNAYITGAGGGVALSVQQRIAKANQAIVDRANEQAALAAAAQKNKAIQEQAGREAALARRVQSYVGPDELPPEATNRDIVQRGIRNIGLMEAFKGGGRAAYEKELEAERIKALGPSPGYELGAAGRVLQPAPGYELGAGRHPAEVSQYMQALREPWTMRRLGEPLARKYPTLWEEYSAPRGYAWGKGAAHVPASMFTAEEPLDMPFKDFLGKRLQPVPKEPFMDVMAQKLAQEWGPIRLGGRSRWRF